jgi:hypothetical protein
MSEPYYFIPPELVPTLREMLEIPKYEINGVDLEKLRQELLSDNKTDYSGNTNILKEAQ